MKHETIVAKNGTTTIPKSCREALGITPGTILNWQIENGKLVATKKPRSQPNLPAQIRKHSGTWPGASKILRRTRARTI